MNNFNNPWQNPYSYTNNVNNVSTNWYKVVSLDEAIMKSTVSPSDNIFFSQDKPEFYHVVIDINGNKSWQTISYNKPESPNAPFVTKEMFDELVAKVNALEAGKQEVPKDAQSNG